MNAPFTDSPEFSIGKPVRRSEDPALVQGMGRYSDDVSVEGQAYGVVGAPYAAWFSFNLLYDKLLGESPGFLE